MPATPIVYPDSVVTLRQKVEYIINGMVAADALDWPPTSVRTRRPIEMHADLGPFVYVSQRVRLLRGVPYGRVAGVQITQDPPLSVHRSLERHGLDIVVYHPWQASTGHLFAGGRRSARLSDKDFD